MARGDSALYPAGTLRILGPMSRALRPRWLTAAVALLVACTVACTPASPEPPPAGDASPTVRPQLLGTEDEVLMLGDSLTNGAAIFGGLGQQLGAAGFEDVEIIAEDSRDIAWAIEQVEDRTEVADLVVVELGTNPDADPEGFDVLVAELIDALRDRGAERIAWVTPVHGRDDRYAEKVAVLAAHPGIDSVADWASVVHENPRRLASDGIHPVEAGYVDLAAFLVSTAAELAG